MSDYMQIIDFLSSNEVTHEQMQHMWDSLYKTNWKVKNLTDSGENWCDLNVSAMKSLIEQFRKNGGEND